MFSEKLFSKTSIRMQLPIGRFAKSQQQSALIRLSAKRVRNAATFSCNFQEQARSFHTPPILSQTKCFSWGFCIAGNIQLPSVGLLLPTPPRKERVSDRRSLCRIFFPYSVAVFVRTSTKDCENLEVPGKGQKI